MTLRLRKYTQAELIAAMNGGRAGGVGGGGLTPGRSGKAPMLPGSSASSGGRGGAGSPGGSARSASPADSSVSMTLDAFASSLAQEEAAKPSALQPLRQLSPANASTGGVTIVPVGSGAVSTAAWQEAGGSGLLFEVELWRQDLLTSVVEIDINGKLINGGLANPLCPPGKNDKCNV